MARDLAPHPDPAAPRGPVGQAPLALTLAALLLAAAAPALAERTDRGIEVDGDYVDDPTSPEEDWFPDFEPMVDPTGSDDDTLCGTPPAPKNDIIHSWLANDMEFLWLAMERLTNNGNTSFFFSFDITGDGPSVGDFIFVFCFGSGSTVTDTYVLEWDPVLGQFVVDGTPPEIVFAVNEDEIVAPFGTLDERGRPSTTIDAGRFAEARVRLSDIEGFDICAADAVVTEIQTKSSCSLASECKDTTGPFEFSFEPLTADLALEQPPGCTPVVVATANAMRRSSDDELAYRWFLDGEEITDRDPAWASSDTIVIELDDECGETEVSVLVDDGTCTVEDAATIDVNRPPVAEITALSAGACDLTITHDGTGSSDCNGSPLTYAWDFDGDGVVDSTEPSGTFTFADCGPRTVSLVVSDGECDSEPATAAVHVNEPPVAALQVVPGECLSVDWAATSTDCDLSTPSPLYTESLSHEVDFGDGTPPASGESGSHAYEACGTYLLTITTTDASGCTSVATREVTFTGVLTVD